MQKATNQGIWWVIGQCQQSGLSGNMIYHRYVITLQLWYNKQSNYMSLLIYHIRYHPPFFGLQHSFLSAPPELQLLLAFLDPRKSRFAPTAHPLWKLRASCSPRHYQTGLPSDCSWWITQDPEHHFINTGKYLKFKNIFLNAVVCQSKVNKNIWPLDTYNRAIMHYF